MGLGCSGQAWNWCPAVAVLVGHCCSLRFPAVQGSRVLGGCWGQTQASLEVLSPEPPGFPKVLVCTVSVGTYTCPWLA